VQVQKARDGSLVVGGHRVESNGRRYVGICGVPEDDLSAESLGG
jgi:hypothetical protein